MNFVRTASVALVLLVSSNLYAQDKAFLVLCDAAPGQLIVLDSQGNWIPDVKSVSITIGIDNKSEMTTVAYVGVIKPTNPKTKTYELVQVKSVSKQQFTGIIDGLQSDPAYVKNSNTFDTKPRANVNDPNERTNNDNDGALELDGGSTSVLDSFDNSRVLQNPNRTRFANNERKVIEKPAGIDTTVLLASVKRIFGDKITIDN
jgi:hypothetical protein